MVGGGIVAVGWCGFSLESLNSFPHTKSQFPRVRALPISPSYPVSDPTSQPKMGLQFTERARNFFSPGDDHSIFHHVIRYWAGKVTSEVQVLFGLRSSDARA